MFYNVDILYCHLADCIYIFDYLYLGYSVRVIRFSWAYLSRQKHGPAVCFWRIWHVPVSLMTLVLRAQL